MKTTRKGLFFVSALLVIVSQAAAYQWWLPGIDIISREERWATTNRMYRESGYFDAVRVKNEAYDLWLRGWGPDLWDFEARKRHEDISAARRSLLNRQFPADIAIDKTIERENGKELIWPFQLVKEKTKIVLHHTADALPYNSSADGQAAMQEFYELHTLKRGRGDIGYNFLIDPFGGIYEWRAWWRGVVGAHTDWNNVSTVGIALMGNFEVTHPSNDAIHSLMQLLTLLAFQYRIDPEVTQPYFTAISDDPYLAITYHDSIVWHKDAKNTACPGQHLYALIPTIKQQIRDRMIWLAAQWVTTLDEKVYASPSYVFTPAEDRTVVWIDAFDTQKPVCKQFWGKSVLHDCSLIGDKIAVEISWVGQSSGVQTIGIKQWTEARFVDFTVQWKDDLTAALNQKRQAYEQQFGSSRVDPQQKTTDQIALRRAQDAMNEDISVLLYNATTQLDKWQLQCEGSCDLIIDGVTIPHTKYATVKHIPESGELLVWYREELRVVDSLSVKTKGWLIKIVNYNNWVLNEFRGGITIEKSWYKHLDLWVQHAITVVNTLPFADYMMGIGESSELQHQEKTRVLAVLAKQYALWYSSWGNRHPSIPQWATYVAIDDPRLFQKYIGSGLEWTRPNRESAVRDTLDAFVVYNWTIPILPYFHCSAWFTRSGREVFGWTDTPWLQTVLDVVQCETDGFQWHGVWLSGDGAQELAEQWFRYDEILRFYYTGVEVVE